MEKKSFILLVIFSNSVLISSQNILPINSSVLFSGSGNCILCHQSDGNAMTWNGVDVSPITYWRSTMMGNASKDPLWRATVAEEVHSFPNSPQMVETNCTKCHSPIGFTQAMYNGQTSYSVNELKSDPLANDGVSCTVCHQIKSDNFATPQSYSGNFIIHPDSILYGPYENSDTTLMASLIGYKGRFGPHIQRSELCATCHTLFTPILNEQGEPVGSFPEQTTYIEWKNSVYFFSNIQCQDCHMPKITDPIKVSGMGNFPDRSPFRRHSLVGGNVYLLNLLKSNIDSLDLTAEQQHFDSTISRTEYNLLEKSIELTSSISLKDTQLVVRLCLTNLSGHKIPTGIPFRRMWIHLKVEDPGSNVVFESGAWDSSGRIINYNSDFEPHYDVITSPEQVQVYEAVFTDANHNVSYKLLGAAQYVKDNRIPPIGFLTLPGINDTVQIYGEAAKDKNFNRYNTNQGTGSDSVTYVIKCQPDKNYKITTEICYQSIKPELIDYLRTTNLSEVDKFIEMYDKLPNLPYIMKRIINDEISSVQYEKEIPSEYSLRQNYPNPFNPSTIINYSIPSESMVTIKIYNVLGQEIKTLVNKTETSGNHQITFNAGDLPSGIYLYRIQTGNFTQTKKMILLK